MTENSTIQIKWTVYYIGYYEYASMYCISETRFSHIVLYFNALPISHSGRQIATMPNKEASLQQGHMLVATGGPCDTKLYPITKINICRYAEQI